MTNFCSKYIFKKPTGHRYFVGLITLYLIFPTFTLAAEPPAKAISLAEAVTRTLNRHPELQALVSQDAVWTGRIQQAAIGERPEINLMVEGGMGTGAYNGLDRTETTLTFSWLLQQEQIDSRISLARTQAGQLIIKKRMAALDLSALTAKRYIEILIQQERIKLNKRAVLQAKEMLDEMNQRLSIGMSSSLEKHMALVVLKRRELVVDDINHELQAGRYRLASLWGEPETNYQLSGDLLALPTIPSVDRQLEYLKKNPHLQYYATAQRIAQSKIEQARIEARSKWKFVAGVRRYEATNDYGLVAGFTLPLGDSNRNAGEIASLRAQQNVLANEQSALMQKLDAQLYVLLQEIVHSREVIEAYRLEIVPQLELAMSEATSAFDKGQLSYNQWNEVRRELLNAQAELLDAIESIHLKHIEIQRLTGTTISQ